MDNRTRLSWDTLAQKIRMYKEEITLRNYANFNSFAFGGLVLTGFVALLSVFFWDRLNFPREHCILFVHFLICNIYIHTFLKSHRQYTLVSLYIAMAPILAVGILMGTFLSPDKNAIAIIVLLCTLFAFITDAPSHILLYIFGTALVFLVCSFLSKPFLLFFSDVVNLIIYLAVGVGVNLLMLKDRVYSAENYVLAMRKADSDTLTSILNRGAGDTLATRLLRAGQLGTFLLIDIDNFKRVNDTYGHQTGDDVICAVAQQLKIVFGTQDVLWRLGGDEFAVFAPGLVDRAQCEAKLKKLQKGLVCYASGTSTRLHITISIGCTICRFPGFDFADVYGMCDSALYETKQKGKDGFVIREPDAPQSAAEKQLADPE